MEEEAGVLDREGEGKEDGGRGSEEGGGGREEEEDGGRGREEEEAISLVVVLQVRVWTSKGTVLA